ncbi:MAG: hypothetical protein GMKNLPBB_01964 [Myxococcota bacterium]|nr:hypothetical protein [Myxococcota bacterium]
MRNFLFAIALLLSACSDPPTFVFDALQRPMDAAVIEGGGGRSSIVFVSSSVENSLRVFNLVNGAALPAPVGYYPLDVPVGQLPEEVLTLPGNRYLMVFNRGSLDISIVDAGTFTEVDLDPDAPPSPGVNGDSFERGLTRIHMGVRLGRAAVSPLITSARVASVWLTLPNTSEIVRLDIDLERLDRRAGKAWSESARAKLPGIPNRITLTEDGGTLYVLEDSGPSLLAADPASLAVRKGWPLPGTPVNFSISPDQRWAYVAEITRPAIVVLDLVKGELINPSPLAPPHPVPGIELTRSAVDVAIVPKELTFIDPPLKGLFAYALLVDGSIRVIDVTGAQAEPPGANAPATRPHWYIDMNPQGPTARPPGITSDGVSGSAADGSIPQLPSVVNGGNASMNYGVVLTEGASIGETWTFTYEGRLMSHSGGTLTNARIAIQGFNPTGDLRRGDRVVITSPAARPDCLRESDILSWNAEGVSLTSPLDGSCFPPPLAFDVRANKQYVVDGSRSGYAGRHLEDGLVRSYPEKGEITRIRLAIKSGTAPTPRGTVITVQIQENLSPLTIAAPDIDRELLPRRGPSSLRLIKIGDQYRLANILSGSNSVVVFSPTNLMARAHTFLR